jgi:phage-related protein
VERTIIPFKNYFSDFYFSLDEETQEKIDYSIEIVSKIQMVSKKFFEKVDKPNDIYEIKAEYEGNIYRILCFFDKGNLIILGNGFQKKTQKTPKQEVEKAIKIKAEYLKLNSKIGKDEKSSKK